MNLKPRQQEQAWNSLLKMANALPQSLVLLGPAGVGKKTAAKAFFQWIHCSNNANTPEEPCGECSSCKKIASGNHVDWIEIQPTGEQISIDSLREMKKTLFFPPMDGKFRFVVIDQAHLLNTASANSLLKTLEEPPSHTRFFLITHERGLLLPTIVSRSQFLHFSPLSEATILELLAKQSIEIPDHLRTICLELLGGGLERSALFVDPKVLEFLNQLIRLSVENKMSWDSCVALAGQLETEEWKIEIFLDYVLASFRRLALQSVTVNQTAKARVESSRALEAAYLRKRLGRYANKKLIALSSAALLQGSPGARI